MMAGSVVISIVLGVFTGVVAFATTGNPRPLADATAGVLFNSDQMVLGAVTQLKDTSTMEANPEKYDNLFVDYLKQRIVLGLGIVIFTVILTFFVLVKFLGINQFGWGSVFIIGLTSILIIGLIQILYVVFTQGVFMFPYQGFINAFLNLDAFLVEPQSVAKIPTGAISWQVVNFTTAG